VFPIAVIGAALTLQANLLRWLGPPGELTAMSVAKMDWPTLVSLLWACIGAALTISARRVGSRVQWTAGAAFLVGAAIKLLLLDFGSLGQLANILAVIAAGGVFLLVGWLAPMPPAHAAASAAPVAGEMQMPDADSHSRPRRAGRERKSSDRFAWTVAIVAITLITVSQCGTRLFHVERLVPSGGELAAIAAAAEAPDSIVAAAPPAEESAAVLAAPEAPPADRCDEWRTRLPRDFEPHFVAAVPADSGENERLVQVDAPGRNVVLVMASSFSTYWTIRVAPDTHVVGIWLPNDVGQEFRNLPDDVAILDAQADPQGCASTGNGSSSLPYAVSQRVLRRPFVSQQQAEEGRWVVVGNSMRQDAVE
jgi:hypothetical protein